MIQIKITKKIGVLSLITFFTTCNAFKPYKVIEKENHYGDHIAWNNHKIAYYIDEVEHKKIKCKLVIIDIESNFSKFEEEFPKRSGLDSLTFFDEKTLLYRKFVARTGHELIVFDTNKNKVSKSIDFNFLPEEYIIKNILPIDKSKILIALTKRSVIEVNSSEIDKNKILEMLPKKDSIFILYDINAEKKIREEKTGEYYWGHYGFTKISEDTILFLEGVNAASPQKLEEFSLTTFQKKTIYPIKENQEFRLQSFFYIKDMGLLYIVESNKNNKSKENAQHLGKFLTLDKKEIVKEFKQFEGKPAYPVGRIKTDKYNKLLVGTDNLIGVIDLNTLEIEKYIRIPDITKILFVQMINPLEIQIYQNMGHMVIWKLEDFLKIEEVKNL